MIPAPAVLWSPRRSHVAVALKGPTGTSARPVHKPGHADRRGAGGVPPSPARAATAQACWKPRPAAVRSAIERPSPGPPRARRACSALRTSRSAWYLTCGRVPRVRCSISSGAGESRSFPTSNGPASRSHAALLSTKGAMGKVKTGAGVAEVGGSRRCVSTKRSAIPRVHRRRTRRTAARTGLRRPPSPGRPAPAGCCSAGGRLTHSPYNFITITITGGESGGSLNDVVDAFRYVRLIGMTAHWDTRGTHAM